MEIAKRSSSAVLLASLALLACSSFLAGCGGGSPGTVTSGTTVPTPAAALTIVSVSPKDVPVGSSSLTLVVTGTGFTNSTAIVLNGTTEPTTFVSSTEVHATVAPAQLQTGRILSVSAVDGTRTAAADPGNNLQVSNPTPTLTTLAPGAALVGSANTSLSVTGTNFVSGAVVDVNGSPRDTAFVSPTQLTVTLPANDLALAGALLFNVTNPQPGGGASGTDAFPVNNPVPTVASLAPGIALAGSGPTVVSISGSGFVAGTGVLVNGANHAGTVTNSTLIAVSLTAADLSQAGSLALTAVNPAPGGGVSPSAYLAVNNPAPGAIALTPNVVPAGTSGATLVTVSGTSFTASTKITVNGSIRPTTYVSATQLLASVSATDAATAGTLSLVAVTPAPGGGSSAPATLSVTNPAPGALLVTPNLVATGTATPTPITVTGANFVPASVVQVNGGSRATTYVSSTQLLSTLTIADQASPGSLSVTAFTPAPGGGTSSAASIAVNNPVLGNLQLSPSVVPAGSTNNITIMVYGSGFLPGTSIQVNGSARATTYVSATQLTFTLLAADAATVGRLAVTASNPAPNAGVSPAATLTVSTPTGTPLITSVNPTGYIVGSGDSSLYVYGTNFTPSSYVQWNGTKLPTAYSFGFPNPGYYLYAQVSAGLLATVGNAAVTVYTPTSLTSTSTAVTVAITNPPVPTLTSVSPTVGPIATSTAITLNGTGFTAGSVISFNGKSLSTTFVNAGSLTALLPASANLFPGVGSFTVNTPAPGGGTSGTQPFTSYVPMVSNSMIYNPVNGLLYLSIPASAGAPYGNSIVSMDPATGALGKPIPVGSEPNKLALTSDGKYLWVGLDGASGVRKVDLTAGVAGLQFAINNGSNNGSPTASALLALPGATDSVIVLQSSNNYAYGLSIYDSGIVRGTVAYVNNYGQYALQVDSARAEIYVGGSGLATYTYDASGLTSKTINNNYSVALASFTQDEMQLVNGKLYTDFGNVYDAEAGTLLGTFYQAGTTAAQGPSLFDTALGKIFTLDSSTSNNYNGYNQIQIFNPANYSATAAVIPINVPNYSYNTAGAYTSFNPHRLVRWGSNGLAFHTTVGVFSLRSNSVKDLSGTLADLGVTVTASGGTTTGSSTTYTATVVNNGPSTATDVALAIQVPSTGVLTAASASTGTCSASTSGCSFGSVASGSTVTATLSVLQTSAGTATLNAQISGSTTDNVSANNTGNASVTVTGSAYNLLPIVSSVAPAAIHSGSADTTITVTGLNFVSGSTVLLGSTALNTSFTSATQLSAIVPAANLVTMGWSSLSVSSPAPGGGASNTTPLTVYSVLALGANHMVYDPFSRRIMASVSTGSSTVAGNSLVAITPETASIGTPLVLSAQPTKLALSGSGNVLYAGLLNIQSIARYTMLTGTADILAIPTSSSFYNTTPSATEIAVQPGTDDTFAMSTNTYYGGFGIYDYTASTKTIAARSSVSNNYYNPDCLHFLDSVNLFANSDASNLVSYAVNSTGLVAPGGTSYNLNRFSCFNLASGKAYAAQGGVATLGSTGIVKQIGSFTLPNTYNYVSYGSAPVAPDPSLGQVFFTGNTTANNYGNADGLLSYDTGTYLRNGVLPLNMPTIEGNTSYNQMDLVRWGQDGLAALTSTGHIYLVRGPFVVPQLLGSNAAATLTSASTITHGAGNTLLTITGSGFVPGVAVTWNGTYRTTTIVDATHLTIAVPAGDLASTGTATLIATNPGAAASGALSVTIQ